MAEGHMSPQLAKIPVRKWIQSRSSESSRQSPSRVADREVSVDSDDTPHA
jgi:hypothetical protein